VSCKKQFPLENFQIAKNTPHLNSELDEVVKFMTFYQTDSLLKRFTGETGPSVGSEA
jgi:hypothetical protein